MNKEATPLETIKELRKKLGGNHGLFWKKELDIIEKALKEHQELLKLENKQITINDFYPNTKSMIDDLLELVSTKMCDFLKEGETYTKARTLELLGTAIRYVKTFAYGGEFNETEKIGVNAKKLKALKIIIDKRVDIKELVCAIIEEKITYNEYYESADDFHYYLQGDYEMSVLTQAEFYLLKEVLI